MEIYILRDGHETGPFSEEATQQMLKQGKVLITDLAWSPGFPEWIPLHGVLYPPPPPPPPEAAPVPEGSWTGEVTPAEPASPRQKAFLAYMGIPFPSDVSHDAAALLVNDALENPTNPARLARWHEDRLKLHPDLFEGEIEAHKKARPIRYFELCETEGAECFSGVSKAHCQVLVEYLDVNFPKWDESEREGAWNYFFPAIAEKFPHLVRKEWKGRLSYPHGPKVAKELKRPTPVVSVVERSRGPSAVGQLIKGAFYGIVLLALLVGAVRVFKNMEQGSSRKRMPKGVPSSATPAQGEAASPGPALSAASERPTAGAPLVPVTPAGESAPTVNTTPGEMAPPAAENPPTASVSPEIAPPLPTASPASRTSSESLFGSTVSSATPSLPAPEATPEAAPATAPLPVVKTSVILTRAVVIPTAYGPVTVPKGTPLRLVGQEGTTLKVQYMNKVVPIPASSTDFGDGIAR